MNRRSAIKMLAGSAVMLGTTRAQSKASRVQIASLDKLESVWSVVQYPYEGRHAILLRVPEKIKDRTLEVQIGIYLVSYHLVCTHLGCTPALPNTDHQLICPCHNSRFWAEDGRAAAARPNPPLKAIQLEVNNGMVFAIGYL